MRAEHSEAHPACQPHPDLGKLLIYQEDFVLPILMA
jgi:hypothetical protein